MIKEFFAIKGSYGRLEWWKAQLFIAILLIPMNIVGAYMGAHSWSVQSVILKSVTWILFFVLIASIVWVSFFSTLKRMQDMELSGGWIVLWFVPFINLLFFLCLGFAPGKKSNQKEVSKK